MTTIDSSNYEQWLVRYADNELSAAERTAVERWLESHPEAMEELTAYCEAPRLPADPNVRFPAVPVHLWWRERPWPAALRWAAVAAVVAAVAVPALVIMRAAPDTVADPVACLEEPIAKPVSARQETEDIAFAPIAPQVRIRPATTVNPSPSLPPTTSVEADEPIAEAATMEQADLPADPLGEEPLADAETAPIAEQQAKSPDTIYTNTLIVYENHADRRRTRLREWLEDLPIVAFFNRHIQETDGKHLCLATTNLDEEY